MTLVTTERDAAGIVTMTLNAPETRNAISELPMIEAILAALAEAQADPEARVIVLTGAGAAFSSGGNIKSMAPGQGLVDKVPAITRRNYRAGIQRLPLAFEDCDLPIVASTEGHPCRMPRPPRPAIRLRGAARGPLSCRTVRLRA